MPSTSTWFLEWAEPEMGETSHVMFLTGGVGYEKGRGLGLPHSRGDAEEARGHTRGLPTSLTVYPYYIVRNVAVQNWVSPYYRAQGLCLVKNGWSSSWVCSNCFDHSFPIRVSARQAHLRQIPNFAKDALQRSFTSIMYW